MKSFSEIYGNIYKECQHSLETARKNALRGNIIVSVIVGIIAIFLTMKTMQVFWIMLGIVVILLYFAFNKKNVLYTKMFKENVIEKFVKEYSSKLNYSPYRGVSKIVYNEGEFEHYDDYYAEDCISGTLEDGNTITMSEVKTQEESTDSDGNRTYTTVFHGLFAHVKLKKIINANIKVRKDKLLFEGKNKMEMDSGEFEKKFTVFSTDKIIAMQLFTADIMQMFIDFKERNKITPEVTIKADNLYIRFNTGEVFEARIIKNALDFDTLLKYYNIIKFTLRLTEEIVKNIKETEI